MRIFRRMTIVLSGALAGLVALLLLLVLVVAPAVPAVAGSSGGVRGTLRVGTAPLVGVQVGFWTRGGTRVARTRSASDGSFRLEVPAQRTGFLAVGAAPTAPKAVFSAGGRHLVRVVIGRGKPAPVAGLTAATTAAAIAARGRLDIRVGEAARITGTSAGFAGTGDDRGEVHLLRADGGEVEVASADAAGTVTTGWVVPGTYSLELFPQPPALRETLRGIALRGGETRVVDIGGVVTGATLRGTVTVGGQAATERIQATVRRNGAVVDAFRTDEHGRYTLPSLDAGEYAIRFGAVQVAADGDAEGPPPPPTADTGLPRTLTVSIDADRHDRTLDVDLPPAGSVGGTLAGAAGGSVVLESASGRVIRVTTADEDRTFALGGLVPGRTYRVLALGSAHGSGRAADARYGIRTIVATAGPVALGRLAIDHRGRAIAGRVDGAAGGRVVAAAVGYTRTRVLVATIGADGTYRIPDAAPGLWRLQAQAADRLAGPTRTADLRHRDATRRDLVAGPRPATFRARFDTGTGGVQVQGSAVSTTGSRFNVLSEGGRETVVATDVAAGTYRLDRLDGTVPAQDGPWWFSPPARSFVLRAAHVTDAGVIVLRVHGR